MSKYYTPEIEEFHVGFEYEVKWNEEKIILYTFPNYPRAGIDWGPIRDRIAIIENLLSSKDKVRVKYLDKEDIESLGFEDKWEERGTWSLVKNQTIITFNPDYTNGNVKISYLKRKGFMFEGQVKNKSELKRILKQLGI